MFKKDEFKGTPRSIMEQIGKRITNHYYEVYWERAWRTEASSSGKYKFFGNKTFNI